MTVTASKCTVLILTLILTVPTFMMLASTPHRQAFVAAEPPTDPAYGRDSRDNVVKNWSIVVAIEYEPSINQVLDIEGALRRGSQYLYDVTDGQFRYAHADIWTHGKNFNDPSTQIQFLDSGVNYRANADRGGIAIQGAHVRLGKTFFGMLWNNSYGGMAIAHEWAHYGLYSPDEYVDVQQGQYLVSVPWCNNCLMSNNTDVVNDTEFCTIDNHNKTNSHAEPQSCWEQIKAHYPTTNMPATHAAIVQNGPFYAPGAEMTFTVHYPDLYISPSDISMSPTNPKEGDTVTLTAKVHNKDSILYSKTVDIKFYDGPIIDDKEIVTKTISLSGQPYDTVTTSWVATGGYRNIYVTVDPNNQILEWEDYTNNTANNTFHVLAKPAIKSGLKDQTTDENKVISLNLKSYESDVESADKNLLWSVTYYDPTFISSIQGQNSLEDVINITPVIYKSGKTTIALSLTDGDGMSTSKDINLTWKEVNFPPLLGEINLTRDWVYRTMPVQISFNGTDPEDLVPLLTPTLEVKPSADLMWATLAPTFDGNVWKATYTPAASAKLGYYDVRAKLTDTGTLTGETYLNHTLQVLDSPPTVTSIYPTGTVAFRGIALNLTVEGSDAEEENDALKVELQYLPTNSQVWAIGGTFNHNTGKYQNGKWTVPFTAAADATLGPCDVRVRLNDSNGPGQWKYVNGTITLKDAPPVVTKFTSDSPTVYRTSTVNLTVEGRDFETSTDKLTLIIEYSIGASDDWQPLPPSQVKVTYDTQWKQWTAVYTPKTDAKAGNYHLRASFRDSDNALGLPLDLKDGLQVKDNPPKVKFTARTSVKTGEVVTFDAKDTTDVEDNNIYMKYAWDFKDGGKGTSSRVSHAFNKAGLYEVTLTVTDKDGVTSNSKTTVTVAQGNVIVGGNGLGMVLIAVIVVVIVVVLVVLMLVMKKKGMGPFKAK